MNLSSTIKSIQDIMRKDDGVDGDAQRIGQLTWMLFLKVFDQREEEWEEKAKQQDEVYQSPMPTGCRWRDWAAFVPDATGKPKAQMEAGELIRFVNNDLFPKLRKVGLRETPVATESNSPEDAQQTDNEVSPAEPASELIEDENTVKQKVIRQVFEDSNNYMKSGTLMLGVIEKLDAAINFHDFTTRQHLGDIYEQILNDLRSAGNAGEFYTPRAITQIMVQLVNPRLGELVMDPACGTGGFLTATISYLRTHYAAHKQSIETSIRGIEKKQLPHLLCVTNLLLHEIDIPSQIDHLNTLAIPWKTWGEEAHADCVITNPPFGGMEGEDVGNDYPENMRTRETADMFLMLIVEKLLKDGGRGAVVLPDGFLFGDGLKAKVKELLLTECNLHTIVRLPNGVFAPYTGIKTNLLFFTKGKATETIWFYEHPYPPGQKSYSKTKPIRFDEFNELREWWGKEENDFAKRVENERAWKLDFRTKKQTTVAQAQPYQDRANELNNEALALENAVRELRNSNRNVTDPEKRKSLEEQTSELREQAKQLRLQATDAQATWDRLYWPIYNLDIKNPNVPDEESHDPDVLLEKYKRLLADIEETQELLKSELAAVLAHHFEREVA